MKKLGIFAFSLCTLLAGLSAAQQGEILEQQVDPLGEGYTVMRVWGSPHEMGYAHGNILANEIVLLCDELKVSLGTDYVTARTLVAATIWKPAELQEELEGMVEGVKAVRPNAAIDVLDLKLMNAYGDWAYACRSHASWGAFVQAPTKTLATRRLDFATNFDGTKHHLLLARQPSGGVVRWVSLAWPGFVNAVTAVNEFGTLASLHDYQSIPVLGAYMPRMVAVRHALTLVAGLPPEQHLDAVYSEFSATSLTTGTFLNYYVPEGLGGVITCPSGQPCNKKRVPQADYHGGQVLLTTNSETDGHSVPGGGEFMDDYYGSGGTKTISDHYGLMGHTGMHLMSVDYRGRGDMTIWAEGRTSVGVTPTMKVEFATLFDPVTLPDGGVTDGSAEETGSGGSAGGNDAGTVPDSMVEQDATSSGGGASVAPVEGSNDTGCGCRFIDGDSVPGGMFFTATLGFLRNE